VPPLHWALIHSDSGQFGIQCTRSKSCERVTLAPFARQHARAPESSSRPRYNSWLTGYPAQNSVEMLRDDCNIVLGRSLLNSETDTTEVRNEKGEGYPMVENGQARCRD